jgi:hypothetical protein
VVETGSDTVLRGWRPLSEDGCTGPFEFQDAGGDVRLEYRAWSHHPTNNDVVVYDCTDESDGCVVRPGLRGLVLPPGGGSVVDTDLTATNPARILWALTFAETRRPMHADASFYAAFFDQGDMGNPSVVANRTWGGHATTWFEIGNHREKYTLAHEYGHAQTLIHRTDIERTSFDYCHETPVCENSSCDASCEGELCEPGECTDGQHALDSGEWQQAAANEGFASWYAMSVWNDPMQVPPGFPNGAVWISPAPSQFALGPVIAEIGYDPVCVDDACPAGVANEMDWAFALWELEARNVPAAGYLKVGNMAAASFPAWPPTTEPEEFWAATMATWASALGEELVDDWLAIAEVFWIAQ